MNKIWIRAETRNFEKRAPLSPEHASALISAGHEVKVERSEQRIFTDKEYELAGCQMVEKGAWKDASLNHYILGIKDLGDFTAPILHQHIYFAHAYKFQSRSDKLLSQFKSGGGIVYDYEYLIDILNNSLVTSSFSYWAGYCGAAVTLNIWFQKLSGSKPRFKIPKYYEDKLSLLQSIRNTLENSKSIPKVVVIGGYGNSGSGICALLEKLEIPFEIWGSQDTKSPERLKQICTFDILFNCALINSKIPPFLTLDDLVHNEKLSLIGDISCDAGSPLNPLPIYDDSTEFDDPTIRVISKPLPVDVMAIDHLPTLLARRSSRDFSAQLLPFLLQLLKFGPDQQKSVWNRAKKEFFKACEKYDV